MVWAHEKRISITIFAKRAGYEEAAVKIQDLYLSGKKDEAAAAVPDKLVDECALVGPADRIRDRLQAWREAARNNQISTLLVSGNTSVNALRLLAEEVL